MSVRWRLFIALWCVLGVGYASIQLFIEKESRLMEEKAQVSLEKKADFFANSLSKRIGQLQKEIAFLAKLEIMDDLLAQDVDRRIASLLALKATDLGKGFHLYVYDVHRRPIASSDPMKTAQMPSSFSQTPEYRENHFFYSKPIFASFDSTRPIGWLVLAQPVEDLLVRLHQSREEKAFLKLPGGALLPSPKDSLSGFVDAIAPIDRLPGWHLLYRQEKSSLFRDVEAMNRILMASFAMMALLTMILALWVDRWITKPIKSFDRVVEKIMHSGRFSYRMPTDQGGEIGHLQRSFNQLFDFIESGYRQLNEERRAHAEALQTLLAMLQALIRSDDEKEAIDQTSQLLGAMVEAKKVHTCRKFPEEDEHRKVIKIEEGLFFVIEEVKKRPVIGERFYEGVALSLSMQLRHIRLVKKLHDAYRSKNRLFAAFSHELRTPLGAIMATTQHLIASQSCDRTIVDKMASIEGQAMRLLQIINDILLLSRAESGRLTVENRPIDLVHLLSTSYETLLPIGEDKGLQMIYTVPFEEWKIQSDEKLLRHMILNLLDNAIKYTPSGYVALRMEKEGTQLRIVIEDSGLGVTEHTKERLFDEFFREEKVKEIPGSVLGLSICRQIASLLSIHLDIESEGAGLGTVVTITIDESAHSII